MNGSVHLTNLEWAVMFGVPVLILIGIELVPYLRARYGTVKAPASIVMFPRRRYQAPKGDAA